MIISEKNRAKIESKIEMVQGRCRERTITADDIFRTVQDVEQYRVNHNIPKRAMEGTCISGDPNAQDFPNAYKWTPMSTQYMISFEKGKYRLDNIQRTICMRAGLDIRVYWSDEAKEKILDAARVLI